MVVNEVITEFGFQGSTKPLDNYNAALGDSIKLLTASAAAIGAAAGATIAFVTSTTKAIDPMIQLSRQTGVAVERIQELSYIAEVSGSSTEALQSSLDGLSEKIGEAAQQGSDVFARLGISARNANGDVKNSGEVLDEVRQRFDELGLSMDERRSFAQQLGIDPSLIQLLSRTDDEMASLSEKARQLGVVTTEQADAAAELNDSMATLRFGTQGLRNSIAVGLAPQITEITNGFVEFLAQNRELISEGISKVLEFIQTLAASIGRLLPVIGAIAAAFGVFKIASIGLGTVLGTVFSPVYVITAALGALLFIIDDLIVAFKGGESVVADFFQEFLGIDIVPILKEIVRVATDVFKTIADVAGRAFDVIANIAAGFFSFFTGEWDAAGDYFSAALDGFIGLFDSFAETLIEAGSYLAKGIWDGLSSLGEWFIGMFSDAFDWVDSATGGLVSSITDPLIEGFKEVFSFISAGFDKVAEIAGEVAGFFGFGDEVEEKQEKNESEETQKQVAYQRNKDESESQKELTRELKKEIYNESNVEKVSEFVTDKNLVTEKDILRDQVTNENNVENIIYRKEEIKERDFISEPVEQSPYDPRMDDSPAQYESGVPDYMMLQPNSTTNTNSSVSNSVQQDVKIDIKTDNPSSAGESVRTGLQAQLSDAQSQFNVGGV